MLGVRSAEEAYDLDDLAFRFQKVVSERKGRDMKIDLRNTNAKRDIQLILKEKQLFIDNSYGKTELKSKLGLLEKEISQIRTVIEFGETRYMKQDIFDYMNRKNIKK